MKKLNYIFISLLLILRACDFQDVGLAQQPGPQPDSQQNQWYEISDFAPGLQSHISSYMTPKGAFTDALNVRFNVNYGAVSKRSARVLLSQCHAAPVKSLYRFYKDDETKYTIQTSGTSLSYVSDSTGLCTDLLTTLTNGARWTWVTYKNNAIGTDGTDRAVKWDGNLLSTANTLAARTAGDLATQLGAPFAQLYTGTDLLASKWYQYKVAYYDGEVYKFSQARSNPLLTGTSVHDISLSDIPLGAVGTTERLIYRTLGQTSRVNVVADSTYYLVGTINDNSTRTYNDTNSDSTISSGGGASPTWSTVSAGIETTPPLSTLACIHQEYLFFANDPSGTPYGKSTVYWSSVFNPDYFTTATDYDLIRADDGDQITSISNFLSILTISKENSWQKLYTNTAAPSGWTVGDPVDPYGCIAPYSSIVGTGGIYYLSRAGLRTFNGQASSLISDVVTDKINDIQASNLNEVVGAFQNNQYFLAYTSQSGGSAINDKVLLLDLTRNAYAEDTENVSSFAVFGSGTDTGILYSGSSGTDGSTWAHSQGFYTLIQRYKSDLDAGTFSHTQSNGTEQFPYLSLGSNETWAGDTSGAWNAESTSTWLVEASPGTWISPVIEIDASKYEKLYWNANLGSTGNITFAIRGGATSGDVSSASWSSEYTTGTGSDISGLTAYPFIQIRATLSTSDFTQSPIVFLNNDYLIQLDYDKAGLTGETSIPSFLQTGYTDLGLPISPYYPHPQNIHIIKEIQVHYTGTLGTMTIGIIDDDNKVNLSFPIDLSVDPTASGSAAKQYYGTSTDKIYDYIVPINDNAVGRKFKFTVTENGNTDWQIRKISVRSDSAPYTLYQ